LSADLSGSPISDQAATCDRSACLRNECRRNILGNNPHRISPTHATGLAKTYLIGARQMLKQIKTAVLACATSLIILTFFASSAVAYEKYDDGCDTCHGGFKSGNYTSNKDGTSWGTDLMSGHEDFTDGN